MKDKILKISGCKTLKEFYSKYPTEEAFLKKHGKEFEKAQAGYGPMSPTAQPIYPTPHGGPIVPKTSTIITGTRDNTVRLFPNSGIIPSGAFGNVHSYTPREEVAPWAGKANLPYNTWKANDPNFRDYADYQPPPIEKENPSPTSLALQGIPILGDVLKGVDQLKAQKKALKKERQNTALTDVASKALLSGQDNLPERKYVRPEDTRMTGEEMFPVYGVGTNVTARNGAEIQNVYNPGTLYSDLEYEKMQLGGALSQLGGNQQFGDMLNSGAVQLSGGESAGATFGGAAGSIVGMIPGMQPFAPFLKAAGSVIGNLIDTNPEKQEKERKKQERNMMTMMGSQVGSQMQGMFSGSMENGGMLNDDYVQYRAGGHLREYTPPSPFDMQTMERGGNMHTLWGGYGEDAGDGETVIFRGNSHSESDGRGNTGIGLRYGDNNVEVEGGETFREMYEGGNMNNDKTGVVFGNLTIPPYLAKMTGQEEFKNMKFKNAQLKIAKDNAKYDKLADGSLSKVSDMEVYTPFDKIKMDSLAANIRGAQSRRNENEKKTQNLAELQNTINEFAEFNNINADAFVKGKIKKAQDGTTLPKLSVENYDKLIELYKIAEKTKSKTDVLAFQKAYHDLAPEYARSVLAKNPLTTHGKKKGLTVNDLESNEDSLWGVRTMAYRAELGDRPTVPTPVVENPPPKPSPETPPPPPGAAPPPPAQKEEEKEQFPWGALASTIYPYIRPTDQEALSPMQLLGEMYALGDRPEPVYSQSFQPLLNIPHDISYQDKLNEVTAQERATSRMLGYNPAASAGLAGQTYAAKSNILAEQFRANQAMKDKVYGENRDVLNKAGMINLDLRDKQYERQQKAISNTKTNIMNAMSSISNKYMQNQLANRTLGTYENLYNYRYGDNFRTQNWNPLVFFDTKLQQPVTETKGEKKSTKKTKGKETPARNGSILKALKRI